MRRITEDSNETGKEVFPDLSRPTSSLDAVKLNAEIDSLLAPLRTTVPTEIETSTSTGSLTSDLSSDSSSNPFDLCEVNEQVEMVLEHAIIESNPPDQEAVACGPLPTNTPLTTSSACIDDDVQDASTSSPSRSDSNSTLNGEEIVISAVVETAASAPQTGTKVNQIKAAKIHVQKPGF